MLKPTALQDKSRGLTVSDSRGDPAQLAVAATFTAEPLQEVLKFWLAQLNLDLQVVLADYNQVFQQLLNPVSLMARNTQGINLLLIRVEDWLRFQTPEDQSGADQGAVPACRAILKRNSQDLISALSEAVQRTSIPHIVVFCPSNPAISAEQLSLHQQVEKTVIKELTSTNNLYLISSEMVFSRYPVDSFYQANGDRLGHIPFTPEAFVAIGTTIIRTVYALKREPYKVIALDCDRTLWRGICGEDGPLGIAVDQPFQALQSFMVRCSQAGFLLCLCSKNVEDDVWQVFDQRDDMPLTREHLVGWRINWQPKSENLRSLATELNLGLDSFIFIDDNPVECSEVKTNCPEVLTLQLPGDPDQIISFLNHIWPLDTLKITATDQNRTQLYQQNIARQQFAQKTGNFHEFIQGLQLDVHIAPPSPQQLSRVAQLTQRTNQFNATTRRRHEAGIQELCSPNSGYDCQVVTVKDRFGDYGLVGVIICQIQTDTLNVDTFLLSCRVLGRGVEHQMIAHLGAIAASNGCSTVTLNYHPTPKNLPIADFFRAIGQQYCHTTEAGQQYTLPANLAQQLTYEPDKAPGIKEATDKTTTPLAIKSTNVQPHNPNARQQRSKSDRWHEIVRQLQQARQIAQRIEQETRQHRSHQHRLVALQTSTEKKLGAIWKQVLQLDRIGRTDNFFDLGGTSILAVGLFTAIEAEFNRRLPLSTLLDAPTLRDLANLLDRDSASAGEYWSPIVTVRAEGSKTPLFVVHGGYGDVLSTAKIINYLDPDQPLYLIRGIGLDGQQVPLPSVESMASAYIEAIKQVQPSGPYQLAGRCSGGIIAFEMAQQLQQRRETVEFLGLLDTPHPQLKNQFANRIRYYFHKPTYRHHTWDFSYYLLTAIYLLRRGLVSINYHWDQWHHQSLGQRLQHIKKSAKWIYKQFVQAIAPSEHDRSSSSPCSHPRGHRHAQANVSKQEYVNHVASRDTSVKDRFVEVFLRAQKDYIPKHYNGKIDFFLTMQHSLVPRHRSSRLHSFQSNPEPVQDIGKLLFGWDKLVTAGNFQIRCVDCPHPLMFDAPYVQQLSQAIQIAIDQRVPETSQHFHAYQLAISSTLHESLDHLATSS